MDINDRVSGPAVFIGSCILSGSLRSVLGAVGSIPAKQGKTGAAGGQTNG